jgi:hypothetical protein
MHRGILAIVTFLIAFTAWVFVLIYPSIFSKGSKQILIRSFILSLSIFAIFLDSSLVSIEHFSAILLPIVTICIVGAEIAFLFMPKRQSFIPLITGFFTFCSAFPIVGFCNISYKMWNRKVDVGAVDDTVALALIHTWFILLFCIIVIVLLVRIFKRFSQIKWLSTIGTLIFLFCINFSFYCTVPHYGDEGIEVWLFIVPIFLLADIVLLLTVLILTIVLIIQQSKEYIKKPILNMLLMT